MMADERPRPEGQAEEPPSAGAPPTEEELRAAMEEQLRRVRVEDVLLQSVATLVSLAGRRLGLAPGTESERDLVQARLAIEGTRALIGLLPESDAAAVREPLSQLQIAYAREARAAGAEQATAGGEDSTEAAGEAEGVVDEAERARARAKIWTPPGA